MNPSSKTSGISERPASGRGPAFWWTLFALAATAILAFIPYANQIEKPLRLRFGADVLRAVLVAAVVAAVLGVVVYLARRRPALDARGLLRLVAVPAVVAVWMSRIPVVAEAFHLVEYGLLGILAFRALSFSLPDRSVLVAAAVVAASVGVADEFVQWILPKRYWDWHDLGLNVAGAVMSQLWIATGWRVPWIFERPSRRSRVRASVLVVTLIVLGAVLVLVPALSGTH